MNTAALTCMLELTPAHQPIYLDELQPRFEFVFETRVLTGPISRLPRVNGSDGELLMMNIEGGDIYGPRLAGKVLPGGTEWPVVRPDGVSAIDARYTLLSSDGTPIGVRNTGFRHGPPEVMARLLSRTEVVDARTYYFRTSARFDAPAGPHAWLSSHVFIGVGERHPDLLYLRYYQVL